jgi:hypothetical protein
MSAEEDRLDALLKKQYDKAAQSLLPEELTYLIAAFVPSKQPSTRSKAYLVLSAFCQAARGSASRPDIQQVDPASEGLAKVFEPLVTTHFSEHSEDDQLIALSFLTALFQVDWQSASVIFTNEGCIDYVVDSLDIAPSSQQVAIQVAHLLGQASGHKSCRSIVSSHSLDWLQNKSRQSQDKALRAACAISLVKIFKGGSADDAEPNVTGGHTGAPNAARDEDLARLMKGLVIEQENQSSVIDAVEGLAYLSVDSTIKEVLVKDEIFLQRLLSLVPSRKIPSNGQQPDPTLLFGIVIILVNLCARPRNLSDEETQLEKLKRMAAARQTPGGHDDRSSLEDDVHVKERGRKLVAAGALDALCAIVRFTESKGALLGVGKALLSLVESKEVRGKVLQSGGAKALMQIIKRSLSSLTSAPAKPSNLDVDELSSIQALAKLAITASPVQVFGPAKGAAHDAVRPFCLMLLHPSATLLQRFESMMALTNLTSQPEYVDSVIKVNGLLNKVEFLLLDEHVMIRRAAMELICNLCAGSEEMFERWGTEPKLQILVALSDVDDVPTRLAASGTLAIATAAPSACAALSSLHQRRGKVVPILTQLIETTSAEDAPPGSDTGLVHRGVVCARNFLMGTDHAEARRGLIEDAEKAGLVTALKELTAKGTVNAAVLKPAAELLQWLRPTPAQPT